MVKMKTLPLDYATKDYDGFMEMFKELIPVLTPEWTDMSDTDQGVVILQLLAYANHIISYNMDKGINENLIQNAKTRRAVLLLSKFLGYSINKQKPAVANITFHKLESALNKEVIIPEGIRVSTDPELGEAVIFETDIPLIIPAGQDSGIVSVTQGNTVTNEEIGIGSGGADQRFVLVQPEVLEDSINLQTVENGSVYKWDWVENFLESLPNDRHYSTTQTEDGDTVIFFGDGVTGMRPPYSCAINATYRHGGGTKGNLAAGKINTLYDDFILDIESVENLEESHGGVDYEDLDKVKTLAPKNYRTGGSAVTPEDFQDLAETFPGISRAVCIETFNATNDVNLYLATDDGVPLTAELMSDVKEHIEDVMVMNQNLYVYEVSYHDYDVTVTVYLYDNFAQADVRMEVEGTLRNALSSNNFEFGETIYLGSIVNSVFGVRGVKNAIIELPTADVTPAATKLPRLNTLTVNLQGGVV